MAEQVQAILDGMVAPLRDLKEREIFSEAEIRSIVSRRRESEYLLRRRAVRKADYLRYIEAEMALEKLRGIRTRRVLARQKRAEKEKAKETGGTGSSKEKKKKNHSGDAHIVQHVHFLFTRVIRKFRSDVALHLQHAAFAKETKSYARLGKIYAEALQVHPRNVGLWIEAASHEFFGHFDETSNERIGGGSVQSARVLLQRGLRINASSQDLWLQYFALEFHHIQKMRGRRAVIMEGGEFKEQQTAAANEETDPLFTEATIPTVVYKNAIKAISSDVTFRLKFLDLCRSFPETNAVESIIMDSVERDFHDKPEAWIARAAYAGEKERSQEENNDSESREDNSSKLVKRQKGNDGNANTVSNKVVDILEEATDHLPTAEMYLESIHFVRDYVTKLLESESDDGERKLISENIKDCNIFLDKLLRKAHNLEMKSARLVMEHANYLASMEKTEDAVNLLEEFVTTNDHSTEHVAVWVHLARMSEQLQPPRSGLPFLHKALKSIPMHDNGYKIILLELFDDILTSQSTVPNGVEKDKYISDLFEQILLLSPGEEYKVVGEKEDALVDLPTRSVADACLQYLRYAFQGGGITAARKVYKVAIRSNYAQSIDGKTQGDMSALRDFFDECIHIEKTASKAHTKRKKKSEIKLHLRRLYDSAISLFSDSVLVDDFQQRRAEDVILA
mmetsp:Transcript_16802/g.26075  ORF Transcript_16802/g.26075 Transcript_16802/m.26075 type:complete len:678 (-) Transcript_16802:1342-3375(-)|eukprot:CAMPEP_0195302728 /NCGR_PEP_ID=MMETSP0707-20130614/31573_1 /TAXON_ID=33640 /ORGANISM="Asterionellopsis glacialis, Strain CCMP134" /LENGTH=677 /DNA_ID=CAMNT_0040366061 /DNA_START=83 /DNA_END=2116 /DNA_ORIENTATION=-